MADRDDPDHLAIIKDKLILPFLDVILILRPGDGVPRTEPTTRSPSMLANAINNTRLVKCATHHPGRSAGEGFGLKHMWRSPRHTIRNILGG